LHWIRDSKGGYNNNKYNIFISFFT
jgi:hypothetical protein